VRRTSSDVGADINSEGLIRWWWWWYVDLCVELELACNIPLAKPLGVPRVDSDVGICRIGLQSALFRRW
jgi:hypothetical protein